MAVENSVVLNNPSSVTYYTDTQSGREFVVSVEPAEAVTSKNSSIIELKTSTKEIDKARLATVKKLWQITEQMNILYPENWTRIAAEELASFQAKMVKLLAKEWTEAAASHSIYAYETRQSSLASSDIIAGTSATESSLSIKVKNNWMITNKVNIIEKMNTKKKVQVISFS